MKIRALRSDEIELFNEMESDAFLITIEEARRFTEHLYNNKPENMRALVDDRDNVKVVMELFLHQLWLGATSVPMLGYAGVASPAESRRRGYINQLLEGVWDEFYEQGYNIATLYPFYFPFYKKFGYEQVSYVRRVNLTIKELAKFKPSGNGEWVRAKEEHWEAFDGIYRQTCAGQFGRIVRSQTLWENKMRPWRAEPPRAYLWYDGQGQPQAYIIYVLHKEGDKDREMHVRDMGWTTPELRREVLAFIANHDSQVKKVIWLSPPDVEIQALLDDPRECEETVTPGYMLRFLDARRALEERSWPSEASGNFRLSVQDERIARNNVTLQVEFGGGKVQAQIVEGGKAGLSCHERQLAQMYAGHLSPFVLHQLGLLTADDQQQLEAAQSLFSPPGQPASFMADFF